eukprot:gene25659-31376_t
MTGEKTSSLSWSWLRQLESQELLRKALKDLARHALHGFSTKLQQVHWQYRDENCANEGLLPPLGIRDFIGCLLEECPGVVPPGALPLGEDEQAHSPSVVDRILKAYYDHRRNADISGLFVLDASLKYCLLVKGVKGRLWSFPKGKMEHGEEVKECAIREMEEECGVDVTGLVAEGEPIECDWMSRRWNFHVATGLSLQQPLAPKVQNEIGVIAWCPLTFLLKLQSKDAVGRKSMTMVLNFLPALMRFLDNFPGRGQTPEVVPAELAVDENGMIKVWEVPEEPEEEVVEGITKNYKGLLQ